MDRVEVDEFGRTIVASASSDSRSRSRSPARQRHRSRSRSPAPRLQTRRSRSRSRSPDSDSDRRRHRTARRHSPSRPQPPPLPPPMPSRYGYNNRHDHRFQHAYHRQQQPYAYGHGGMFPPPPMPPPFYAPPFPPPPPPDVLSFPVWLSLQQDTTPSPAAHAAYDVYKREVDERFAKKFYDVHSRSEWMSDRYGRGLTLRMSEAEQWTTWQQCWETDTRAHVNTHLIDPDSAAVGEFVDNTLVVTVVPPRLSRQSVKELFEGLDGFRFFWISEATARLQWNRVGYVMFATAPQCASALDIINTSKVNEFELRLKANTKRISKQIAPASTLHHTRIDVDLVNCRQLIRSLDAERDVPSLMDDDAFGLSASGVDGLNAAIAYLRFVHCFCYYCHTDYLDHEAMFNTCGVVHARSSVPSANDDEFIEKLDKAIAERLSNPTPPPPVSTPPQLQSMLDDFYRSETTQKGEGKFRCELCSKMFKGAEFVAKHLDSKHVDQRRLIEDRAYEQWQRESYMADPNRPMDEPVVARGHVGRNGAMGAGGGGAGGAPFMPILRHNNAPHFPFGGRAPLSIASPMQLPTITLSLPAENVPSPHRVPLRTETRQMRTYADVDAPSSTPFIPDVSAAPGHTKPAAMYGAAGKWKPKAKKAAAAAAATATATAAVMIAAADTSAAETLSVDEINGAAEPASADVTGGHSNGDGGDDAVMV